ncbi:ABC-three component system protein [Ralstonia pseudosolanacearum]|uniref:ABC-three component system protein n=1 Tax=Ralstonia pseudosolanacearum TaxID=1310165 RepID=UPI0018D10258|nr:ABC-three component system protein [Ralstonia pseudosolanacearum]
MAEQKSFTQKTSAGDKSIGFDYQHYYFLYRILNLGTGQSVGLEIKDDVHTELNADFNILYQLKHTVQTNAAGAPVALTELDADLWKTLYNWSQVICDKVDGRESIAAQRAFIAKTEFHLVSNKSQSQTNALLELIIEFQETAKFESLSAHIKSLSEKTKDDDIRKYILSVHGLEESVRKDFLRHVRFELEFDDIIGRVKNSIREKIIEPENVDAAFERLDSRIKSENFLAVKSGSALSISFEEFATRYRKIFQDARSKALVPHRFQPILPDDIFAQKFIKRLIEINALSATDSERAVDYTLQKIRLSTNLEKWVQEGSVVGDEVDDFHEDVFRRWDNEFHGLFKKCASMDEVIDSAFELLKMLRRERFKLSDTELDTKLSNGELYHLSDIGRIGWHRDWADHD